jgi:Pyruvate kinase
MSRRAKIVCTLGPATSGSGTITELVAAGLDVARLNMSHGDHERIVPPTRPSARPAT